MLVALADAGIDVAGRCLESGSLARHAMETSADVVLVASGLHRLTGEALAALAAASIPAAVMLTSEDDGCGVPGERYLIPGDDPTDVVAAVEQAARAGVAKGVSPADGAPAAGAFGSQGGELIVVTSAKGATGTTTLAIALAAMAGRRMPVALLDADMQGGDVVSYPCMERRRRRKPGHFEIRRAGTRRRRSNGGSIPVRR